MRIGCCGSMIAPARDPVGIDIVETLGAIGYDYIELSLSDIAALSPPALEALRRRLDRAGLVCEACNNFFPSRFRLTGADADHTAAVDYALGALDRASALGAAVVVFGSGPAKMVPAGFALDAAWAQLVALLGRLGEAAATRGITIVIEPLNRRECNIVTTAADGLRLVGEVGHPNVRLLVDAYHMLREHEAPRVIAAAGAEVRHVHVAAGFDRRFPVAADADLSAVFACLRSAGYAGRISVEARSGDFSADAPRALALLRWLASDAAALASRADA